MSLNVNKFISGQWIMVVLTCLTYCLIVGYTTWYYVRHATPDKLEGFAMGLVMGFATTAGMIYKAYFDRERSGTSTITTTTGNPGQTEEKK